MIHEFKSQIESATEEGTMTARLVPFGVKVPYGSGTVEFARGGIEYPASVPLTVDHSPGVFARLGVMTRHFETDDGAYAEFQLADTPDGNTLRELLKLGAVSDVSVGIAYDGEIGGATVMDGVLDHVSVVDHGRFSVGDRPAEVLAVHDDKEPQMAENEVEATAPVVEQFDDSELRAGLTELADEIASMKVEEVKDPEFTGLEVFAAALAKNRYGLPIHNHALADVIGDLGSADASGVVHDAYWAGGLQHRVDRRRPLFATGGSAPFPASGNNLALPKVTQETTVAAHSAEKAAVSSQALQAVEVTYPLVWFSGAVDVAMELISQSDPSVLQVIASSMLTAYATAVEGDASTKLQAAGTHTGAALDTATYAALVGDLITTSDLIEDATGAPGDICGVTSAQWIAILSLMDASDRRQFSMMNPQNADGSGSLVTRGIDIGGIFVYRAPAALVALQYNQDSYKNAEKSPMNVVTTNVELMGRDVGILGATVNVTWPEGIYSYEA